MEKMFLRSKVAIAVSDMKKSIAFYTKTLGFTLDEDYGDWAELKGPGITLGLYPAKRDKESGNICIGLEVKDIDATAKLLSKKGVKFERVEEDYMRFAYFEDPDGTTLYLAQKKK